MVVFVSLYVFAYTMKSIGCVFVRFVCLCVFNIESTMHTESMNKTCWQLQAFHCKGFMTPTLVYTQTQTWFQPSPKNHKVLALQSLNCKVWTLAWLKLQTPPFDSWKSNCKLHGPVLKPFSKNPPLSKQLYKQRGVLYKQLLEEPSSVKTNLKKFNHSQQTVTYWTTFFRSISNPGSSICKGSITCKEPALEGLRPTSCISKPSKSTHSIWMDLHVMDCNYNPDLLQCQGFHVKIPVLQTSGNPLYKCKTPTLIFPLKRFIFQILNFFSAQIVPLPPDRGFKITCWTLNLEDLFCTMLKRSNHNVCEPSPVASQTPSVNLKVDAVNAQLQIKKCINPKPTLAALKGYTHHCPRNLL